MNENEIKSKNTGLIVGASALCILGIAGGATALIVAFAGPAGAQHAPAPAPTPSSVAPVAPVSPAVPARPVAPVTPSSPSYVPTAPSTSVETLQRDLGQLNYYEGPINGVMTPETVQSVTYLQRDAGLPQTGTVDQATYQALQRMLVTGNNQMGGNS